MRISRRRFVGSTAVCLLSGTELPVNYAAESSAKPEGEEKPLIVSTWPFGKAANEAALKILLQGSLVLYLLNQNL